jgi:putative spermidine/putrescine transport system permease protein
VVDLKTRPGGAAPASPSASRARSRRRADRWRWLVLPVLIWLLAFFYFPLFTFLTRTVTEPLADQAPWYAGFDWFLTSGTNWVALGRTFLNSIEVTVLCLLLGYPYAYLMATLRGRRRNLTRLLMLGLVLIPFWTSAVVRNYAWVILLYENGPLNAALNAVGLPSAQLLGTTTAVLIGETHVMFPFMVLPLYASMQSIDVRLLDAAGSLGASPLRALRRVYLPLSLPGVLAGSTLTFVSALGFWITPALLGSIQESMLPQVIVTQVAVILDWGRGGVASVVLTVLALALLYLASRFPGVGRLMVSPTDRDE